MGRRRALAAALTLATLIGGCTPNAERRTTDAPWFTDAAAQSGLTFTHFNGMSGEFDYPEIMPPGVALFDYDNDGDLDVFIVQGQMLGKKTLDQALFPPRDPSALKGRLYRNDLDTRAGGSRTLRLTDVTDESGPMAAAEQAGHPELARPLAATLSLYKHGRPCRTPLRNDDPPLVGL